MRSFKICIPPHILSGLWNQGGWYKWDIQHIGEIREILIGFWKEGLNKCDRLKNRNGRIILKWSCRNRMERHGLDLSSLELRPVEGNEPQGPKMQGQYRRLTNYHLLKTDFRSWI
jgi:hypothetical protein